MLNPIKQIYLFNEKASLLDTQYDDCLEDSMVIEECLENHTSLSELGKLFHLSPIDSTPKQLSRDIVATSHNRGKPISDIDRLDKACDKAIIAIGSMAKLGLNPAQITQAFNTVMQANIAKVSAPKDSTGKLTKPSNFVGPEAKLQELLDKRM